MPKLRNYQEPAVSKALPLDSFFNCDDVGAGKTVMALDEVNRYQKTADKAINVCVVTLKTPIQVWEDHVPAWFPSAIPITPFKRIDDEERACLQDDELNVVSIINWAQLRLNLDLQTVKWDYVIADEAQNANNRKAKQTVMLKKLKTQRKRAFTATPVINAPQDMWSLLNWLYPRGPEWLPMYQRRFFSSYWKFFEQFVDYSLHPLGFKIVNGPKNEELLREIIEPFYIRREQHEINPEIPGIPPPPPEKIYVELTPKQRRAYNEMKDEALAWVGEEDDEPVPAPVAIAKLTRLRQFCTAYATLEVDYEEDVPVESHVRLSEPSSKLDALMDIIEGAGGRGIVVFTQFKQLLELATTRFDKRGITYSVVKGGQSKTARREEIEAFVRGDHQVYISTIQAGGVGVDGLQHASNICVFLDRSWSPAQNKQAIGRVRRQGQKLVVREIHIDARNTVDQYVESKLKMKRSWIRRMLGGEE